jgi:hypothetical protein
VAAGEPVEEDDGVTLSLRGSKLSERFPTGTADLRALLRTRAVVAVFQPILTLPGPAVMAFPRPFDLDWMGS